VLTERLGLPPLEFDTTLPLIDTTMPVLDTVPVEEPAPPPPPPAAAVPAVNVLGAGTPSAAPAAGEGSHWGARLEQELRAAVLRQVAEQLPRDIDALVRAHLEPALAHLVAALAAETRRAAAASLQEMVDRAVRAELERLRSAKQGQP